MKQYFFLTQLWCFPRPYELFANHICPFFVHPIASAFANLNIKASVLQDSVTAFFCTTKLRSIMRGLKRSYSTRLEVSLAHHLIDEEM